MIIKSFRIKNYRSIKDSGDCYLSGDGLTILAGMNEAGKTAILEALEDFNIDKNIRDEAIPYNNKELKPQIEITFNIDSETLKVIFEEVKLDIKVLNAKSLDFKITKLYPNEYSFSNKDELFLKENHKDLPSSKKEEIDNLYSDLKNLYLKYPQIGGELPELSSLELINY